MPNLDLSDDEHAALVRVVKHGLASAKNDSQSRWLHYRDHRLGSPAINSRISSDLGLVSSKALQALVMKLRIGDRAALLTHTRLAERRVRLEQPVVLFALRHVALWRPGW